MDGWREGEREGERDWVCHILPGSIPPILRAHSEALRVMAVFGSASVSYC